MQNVGRRRGGPIKHGLAKELRLGNLEARRDWGFAGDYVQAMWLMLQQEQPEDYVIATGETHSVRELVEAAFKYAGLDWKKHVVEGPELVRPGEVDLLIGDPAKARRQLGWRPRVGFRDWSAAWCSSTWSAWGGRRPAAGREGPGWAAARWVMVRSQSRRDDHPGSPWCQAHWRARPSSRPTRGCQPRWPRSLLVSAKV
jgi:hypothetical protein